MGLFSSSNKAPALTRSAQKISEAISALDSEGRKRAIATVSSLVLGIRNMGALPEEVTDELWSVLVTIARKAVMGAAAEKLFNELKDGCSSELLELINREAKA